jgi:hypothetical protein
MSDSFWGTIPVAENIASPYSILKEQAEFLATGTGQLLTGEVQKKADGNLFIIKFFIRAKALNNYKYSLLTVTHDVHLYPVEVLSSQDPFPKPCRNESEFKDILRNILSSEKTRSVVQALLAQIRDEDEIPF